MRNYKCGSLPHAYGEYPHINSFYIYFSAVSVIGPDNPDTNGVHALASNTLARVLFQVNTRNHGRKYGSLLQIILNGITTISTDFEAMGVETANIIQENTLRHVKVPFALNLRASL